MLNTVICSLLTLSLRTIKGEWLTSFSVPQSTTYPMKNENTFNIRCPQDIELSQYNGTISTTNSGRTCIDWLDSNKYRKFVRRPTLADKDFPVDGSIKEAENFCRNVDGNSLPWCYVSDVGISFESCHHRICEVDGPSCGGSITSSAGWFASPDKNIDGFYENDLNCLWLLDAPVDHQIEIDILVLDLEKTEHCEKDFLEIYEASNFDRTYVHATLCGITTTKVKSGADDLYVLFRTDDSVQGHGFNISYTFIPVDMVCLGDIDLNAYSGTVSVTNGGRTCEAWNKYAEYHTDSDFPLDGSLDNAQNYCRNIGNRRLPWCHVTDHSMEWDYCYRRICIVEGPPCGGIVTNSTGLIASPDRNSDGFYENKLDCLWILESPHNYRIEIEILFMHMEINTITNECFDFVEIYEYSANGTRQAKQFCGDDLAIFISNRNVLYVWLKTDATVRSHGFNISYRHIVGPTIFNTRTTPVAEQSQRQAPTSVTSVAPDSHLTIRNLSAPKWQRTMHNGSPVYHMHGYSTSSIYVVSALIGFIFLRDNVLIMLSECVVQSHSVIG